MMAPNGDCGLGLRSSCRKAEEHGKELISQQRFNMKSVTRSFFSVSLLLFLGTAAHAEPPDQFEPATTLRAADVFSAGELRGDLYRVRDAVPTDGYMAYVTVDSDFGSFRCIGIPQARQRIVETEAIRKLVETSKGDMFAEGLKRSIEKPIDAVKNIVSNPVDSVKGAPKTVGHFFSKVGATISRTAERVEKRIDQREEVDPVEAGQRLGKSARDIAGFDRAKLECARQLGVDPYSDNQRLQEEMDKVTWAFFAGGLPLKIGAMAGGASLALNATTMVGLPEEIYAKTADEIALMDKNALKAMGVTDEDISAFQLQEVLNVSRQHRIVRALTALPAARGRGNIVRLANGCADIRQAEFLTRALVILANQQKNGKANYTEVHVLGRLPGAVTSTGELHVSAPVDYVSWTEEVARFAHRDDLGDRPKVLLHTGGRTQAAADGFNAAGWKSVPVELR